MEQTPAGSAPPVRLGRPLRVGLYGGFGTGNTGNDATAAVTVEHLRRTRPDLDLRLITYGPETAVISERLGVPTISTQPSVRPARRSKDAGRVGQALSVLGPLRRVGTRGQRLVREVASTWTALRSVDAVVVLGCGIFEAESTVGGRGWRAMADLYLVSLAASLGRHRLAYAAIGGTVLPTRAERTLVVAAMRRAERRTFRDAASRSALAQMGGGAPDDLVVADLVFAADLTDFTDFTDSDRPRVALGIMSFDWLRREDDGLLSPRDTYLRALAETATALVQDGHDVVVFAGDVADRAAVDVVADEARARLGDDGHHVTTLYATTLTEQVPVLAAAETVIGSRFHNAVTALMVGKAPIVVADRTKVRTLMHTSGLGDQLLEARTLTSPALLDMVDRARAGRPVTQTRTAAAVDAARAGAVRGLDDLDALVQRWTGRAPTDGAAGAASAVPSGESASSDVSVA